jgi:ornithine cyclodeaminase
MTRIVSLAEIERVLPSIDVLGEIERGFLAYSRGKVRVPPVGELLFRDPPGEMHVKYGAIDGDDVFVVKIATGFYGNPARGLPPFSGLMLIFSAITGEPLAVLLDEGHLTNIRTAAAGALAAKYLAPPKVEAIGILGSGVQARLQPKYLKQVTDSREVHVWARDADKAAACVADLEREGFRARVASSVAEVAAHANLIVTTTAAHEPLLLAEHLRPGMHVTAMGSDTPEKCELAPDLLARADLVVADSIAQCRTRGEIFRAVAAGAFDPAGVVELGTIVEQPARGRTCADQITVADLTGVAVQDIQISKAVRARLLAEGAAVTGTAAA